MKTNLTEPQKEKIKKAIEEWKKKVDHLLPQEGRQEFSERERLLRKRKAFDIKGYVKSIYGRQA